MIVKEFIDIIVDQTVIDCNKNNLLPSPTLAQAIIESRYGTSSLAVQGNALFGIKADSRWKGKVITKDTKECYDGINLVPTVACFRAYDSWADSIYDHNQFLLVNKRYSNLVGVRDYKTYCNLIKQDGYATSPTYAQTLINCIEKYNLQQYDVIVDVKEDEIVKPTVEKKLYKFNIHAGHNPSDKVACGSIGYLNESDENRKVCEKVLNYTRKLGHKAYDCTCNDGVSQRDILEKIVAKCNSNSVDYDVSIHFNAISKELVSDDKTKGVEVWIHPNNKGTELEERAKAICNAVASLGFTNRGVKYSDGLYVLKNTSALAMLVECCFVDDVDDFELYDCDKMSKAITLGLTGENVDEVKEDTTTETDGNYYVVTLGYYANKDGAISFANSLKEYGYMLNPNTDKMEHGIITSIQEVPKKYLK